MYRLPPERPSHPHHPTRPVHRAEQEPGAVLVLPSGDCGFLSNAALRSLPPPCHQLHKQAVVK